MKMSVAVSKIGRWRADFDARCGIMAFQR